MKKTLLFTLVLITAFSLFGCSSDANKAQTGNEPQDKATTQQTGEKDKTQAAEDETKSVVYKNTQYGFSFTLPVSWENYTIVTEKWEGLSLKDSESEKVVESGPLISIRHPLWTAENPRQDIPIMVFTQKQWDSLQKEEFHIGAAPIGPSELGRNSSYVFALPARYNFAFPTGYEEVEKILEGKPLKPIDGNQ